MTVRLCKGEWIHPSLITPKSVNYSIGLDEACKQYVQLIQRGGHESLNNVTLNVI